MLPERRRNDAFGVDDGDLAGDPESGVGVRLDPADHRRHRGVVRGERLATNEVIPDGEQDRHQLRSVGGDVEPADRRLAVGPTEQHATRGGVYAGHHVEEVLVTYFATQAE